MLLHGRIVCGVTMTVIPSPSDLIWDESATSLSIGRWIGAWGQGNLLNHATLAWIWRFLPKLEFFQTRYLLKLKKQYVLPV